METALPTIRISEVTRRAAEFARNLVAKLEAINEAYPVAHLSPTDQKIFEELSRGKPIGPAPSELVPVFERLFFAYMASRYVIVPDRP
jgi:hypothetical protein